MFLWALARYSQVLCHCIVVSGSILGKSIAYYLFVADEHVFWYSQKPFYRLLGLFCVVGLFYSMLG